MTCQGKPVAGAVGNTLVWSPILYPTTHGFTKWQTQKVMGTSNIETKSKNMRGESSEGTLNSDLRDIGTEEISGELIRSMEQQSDVKATGDSDLGES
ncbi:hypothetical protein STEG23_029691 [Scotinomys teguina]